MKRITEQRFKGFFEDKHHNKTINFDERILINNDKDLFKQIKKHLDKKYNVNVQIKFLNDNKRFSIIDVLETKESFYDSIKMIGGDLNASSRR